MIYEGTFNYFLDNESKTIEEIRKLVSTNMTVSTKGLDVFYTSPKKEDKLLKQADEIQKQNGGRLDLDSLVYAFELDKGSKWFPVLKSGDIEKDISPDLTYYDSKTVSSKELSDSLCKQMSKTNQIQLDVQNHLDNVCKAREANKDSYSTIKMTGSLGFPIREGKIFTGEGKKETENKLNYELDWGFIQQMAERMSQNKGKYPPNNWKLVMDIDKLKQSLLRHTLEIMKGNDSDDGREMGHYESLALNAMMICYQLKNKM